MGVSGAGKTTLARGIVEATGWDSLVELGLDGEAQAGRA